MVIKDEELLKVAGYQDNNTTLFAHSCEDMSELADESVDLIVTDPPYGLSDVESVEDRVKKVIRCFNDIAFPQFNNGDIECIKYSQFVRISLASFNLRKEQFCGVGIKSWVGVPKSAVDFNYDIQVREIKIATCHKSTSVRITKTPLVDKGDVVKPEFIGDFILDFGNAIDFPISDIGGCNLGQFSKGFFRVPISAISTPCLPNSQTLKIPLLFGDDFVENIRFGDNAFCQPQTSPFVLANWRTKNGFMLTFDAGRRTAEFNSACVTDEANLVGYFLRPQLVRTFSGASCLSSIFEPTRVSFILSATNRAYSYYFHLWLPKTFFKSIAQLKRVGKGFMGKTWDAQVPPKEIWQECLRVLKPGAFAFVMSIPRADCLSRMIISLEQAGFNVSFTPIYHAFASGFPKAQNIGKAVDRRLGAKREITGKDKSFGRHDSGIYQLNAQDLPNKNEWSLKDNPATPQAKALDGSYAGFSPKPAVEIIIVAMKPIETKTYVDQALKNKKGVTWLGDGRIPYESERDFDKTARPNFDGKDIKWEGETNTFPTDKMRGNVTNQGRFPANLLVEDNILDDGRIRISGKNRSEFPKMKNQWLGESYYPPELNYGDTGSFSRYFDLDRWFAGLLDKLNSKAYYREKNNGDMLWGASQAEGKNGLKNNPLFVNGVVGNLPIMPVIELNNTTSVQNPVMLSLGLVNQNLDAKSVGEKLDYIETDTAQRLAQIKQDTETLLEIITKDKEILIGQKQYSLFNQSVVNYVGKKLQDLRDIIQIAIDQPRLFGSVIPAIIRQTQQDLSQDQLWQNFWQERVKLLSESQQRTFPFAVISKASKSEKNKGIEAEGKIQKTTGKGIDSTIRRCPIHNSPIPSGYSTYKCGCKIEHYCKDFDRPKRNYHPTVKPVKLFTYLITLGSRDGDTVLDPFMGSGTTAVACKMMGRKCVGYEISQEYLGIISGRNRQQGLF